MYTAAKLKKIKKNIADSIYKTALFIAGVRVMMAPPLLKCLQKLLFTYLKITTHY